MGEVILGMPGKWADDYRESADHHTTKIGGLPDWPNSDVSVSREVLLCALCSERLCLLAQIYAPLSIEEGSTDRVIYVLGCIKQDCGSNPQSWRVIRVQKCYPDVQTNNEPLKNVQSEEESTSVVQDNAESKCSHFMESGDEESDSDIDLDELAQALEQAATLASHSKKQNGRKHTKKIAKSPDAKKITNDLITPVLPCFYIYSEKDSSKERRSKSVSDDCSSVSLKEVQKSSGNESEGEGNWDGEEYEYDKALSADRTYLKFMKQLNVNPEQCFRYSYGGDPLIPVANMPKPGKCKICGTDRRFELQLMPQLLSFLDEGIDDSSDISVDGWTWLTIIIFSCPKSCCSQSPGEETDGSCWVIAEEEAIIINDD